MPLSQFDDLTLFITGPTHVRNEIRRAASLPEFGHRDFENEKRFGPIFSGLMALAELSGDHGYQVMLFNGSGSTAMEASIRSLVAGHETVLNISVGAFGDLYHNMALANGKNAAQLRFEPGQAADPDSVRRALEEHRPRVVTMTHNETSTGVTNDIVALCDLCREYDALPLVDGVSLFGGAPSLISQAKPAMYVTSTQKCLALPAGFGIAFVSREALAKAETVENRGFSSDILRQVKTAEKHQTLTTPNTALANQMAVQLDHIINVEGVAQRFARHAAMREVAHTWVNNTKGFDLLAPAGHRSQTITAVRAPLGITPDDLKRVKEAMRGQGYLFDPGYGKLNAMLANEGKRCVFRIGHLGDLTPEMLFDYLEPLKRTLRDTLNLDV